MISAEVDVINIQPIKNPARCIQIFLICNVAVPDGLGFKILYYFFLVLEPYKYAGYPMLITTIDLETNDDQLFSKSAPLLSAASELAYHTMDCSALNAEELRRENGIQTLHNAFARCISTLSAMSKPGELAVQVGILYY